MKLSKSLSLLVSKSLSYSLILLFAYSLISLLASPVMAQATPQVPTFNKSWVDGGGYPTAMEAARTQNQVSGESYNYLNATILPMHSLIEQIAGCVVGVTCTQQQAQQRQGYIQEMNQRSALSGLNGAIIAIITNPPADTRLWLADVGQTLGFLPRQAFAQGIGFTGLSPLLGIWKAFRNIAYVLLALVMLVVGFMVMFRKKIDPKTVVTVQNALPRIVVTLLLITFSYAIAGLMIDLMYLVMAFGVSILKTSGFKGTQISVFGIQADLMQGGVLTLLGSIFAPLINSKLNPAMLMLKTLEGLANPDLWASVLRNLGQGLVAGNADQAIRQATGQAVGAGVEFAAYLTIGPFLLVLLSLAYLFAFVRIFFMLLSAYIQILLAILVGPIQILMEALPGTSGFSSWLKNLFVNLVPFPITVFMLTLGNALIQNIGQGGLWQPPLLPQVPAGATAGLAVTLLWLGIILTIPSVVGSIKEALKTKALAGAGAVTGPIMEAFQTGTGALSLFYYGASIRGMFPGKQERPRPGG